MIGMTLKVDAKTWIISDTHFGHYNMIKFSGRPLNFNEKLIEKWNKTVGEHDDILHLGDVCMFRGPLVDMWQIEASKLPGNKYLIRGNHDKSDIPGFTTVDEQLVEIGGTWILLTHEPKPKEDWFDINIHGHLHGNKDVRRDYPFDLDYHFDVGVEVIGYAPKRLGAILTDIKFNIVV